MFYIGFSFHPFKIELSQACQFYVFHLYAGVRPIRTRYASILLMNINLTCKKTFKMPFIGDFSLQNVRSNFQRQTKKNIFDVSLSAGRFALMIS